MFTVNVWLRLLSVSSLVFSLAAVNFGPHRFDIPDPGTQPFYADLCAGMTYDDPRNALEVRDPLTNEIELYGDVSDLTYIFGERLTSYLAGNIVPLYDSYGGNAETPFPPLCGVRYVDDIGPVSEWMFCTDYFSLVCGRTGPNGELMNENGTVVGALDTLTGNPKFVGVEGKNKEKIISYLIKNGWSSYEGVGYFDHGTAQGKADGSPVERTVLQYLIWCISDYPSDPLAINDSPDRKTTCDQSIPLSAQQDILLKIPDTPTVQLQLTGGGSQLRVGDTVTFRLDTNIYQQAINLNTSGVTGTLTVSSGATLASGTITVVGTDPDVVSTVQISFTATSAGIFHISADFTPASDTHLQWNQSPTIDAGKACQVFAVFQQHDVIQLSGAAQAVFTEQGIVPTPPLRVDTHSAGISK